MCQEAVFHLKNPSGRDFVMNRELLETYAELIVAKGLNLDPGQEVIIVAGLDQPDFLRMTVEKCYRHGAGKVIVDFRDMPLARLDNIYQSCEKLSAMEEWEIAKLKWRSETLPAFLWLDSEDPDGMNGVDQEKRAAAQKARFPIIKPFRDAMENKYQWCIAAVPGREWARKVFPGVSDAVAEEKLWEAILQASRANGDAVANWDEHNATIHRRCKILNEYRFAALEYHSSNGTDFRVGLMEHGVFAGASEKDLSGREFNPNIPSEEVFTTPKRGEAEGLLVATKPLSWQGTLIENFSIRFKDGKAVEVKAEKGQEALEKMISMDEGAPYLGECALIGSNSPINNMGILFYNTLFDENACCHVALGRGFDVCVENFADYTLEELRSMGVNDSMIHVDFMIGSPDMEITGVTVTGERVPVFRAGEWVF